MGTPHFSKKNMERAAFGEHNAKTSVVRISEPMKEQLLLYKEQYMNKRKGYVSFNDVLRNMFIRLNNLEDKVLKMPWRYKVMHKWILGGDTEQLLELLRDDVARITETKPDDPCLNIDHRHIDDMLQFLNKTSKEFDW